MTKKPEPAGTTEFRSLSDYETDVLNKMLKRGRVHPTITLKDGTVNLDTLEVSYSWSEDNKFTTCRLIKKNRRYRYLHTGVTKRITYGPTADSHDMDRATAIALCRALESTPTIIPTDAPPRQFWTEKASANKESGVLSPFDHPAEIPY